MHWPILPDPTPVISMGSRDMVQEGSESKKPHLPSPIHSLPGKGAKFALFCPPLAAQGCMYQGEHKATI